jgi:hypothetical protein
VFAICAGMLRSGSTFQYQVVCHMVEAELAGKRLGFFGIDCLHDFREEVLDNRWRVFKVHEPHSIYTDLLGSGRAKCFYTYRDVRDVVYSLKHRLSIRFEESVDHVTAVVSTHDRFWRSQPNTLVQRYEDIVLDNVAMVNAIASHLDIGIDGQRAAEIAAEYSIGANRTRVQALLSKLTADGIDPCRRGPNEYFDKQFELHWNHIRTGAVGAWRHQASDAEAAHLNLMFGDWLQDNGYV